MPITFDLEADALYKKGINKGRLDFAQYLIEHTDFLDEKIASLVGVDVAFVKKVRADLERLKK
jgi:hypothetical protein